MLGAAVLGAAVLGAAVLLPQAPEHQSTQAPTTSSGAPAPKSGAPLPKSEPLRAEIVERPVALRQAIGEAHEPVTTSSPKAQRYYDQGLAYLHSFVWIEAARSFNDALRIDPRLAMAQLGLSYALGELDLPDRARQASRRAQELSAAASPRERFRIDLRARQLTAADRPGDAAAMSAYRAQLAQVDERFATDVELLLIVGHAQDPAPGAHGMNGGSGSLGYYQRALAIAPDYFAVHHFLAHAYENIGEAKDALPHARRFALLASAVPHAHHMYGHVLRQVDRMSTAVAEFKKADELHLAYAAAERIPPALDWHYRHNLDLLGTSYQYLGQMAQAEEVLRRSFEMPASGHLGHDQDVNKRAWPLFLLGRGRSDEALAAAAALQQHASPLLQALGHALASRILVATKSLDRAAAEGNVALRAMRAIGPAGGMLLARLPACPRRVSAADRRDGQRPGDAAGRGREAARGARSRSCGSRRCFNSKRSRTPRASLANGRSRRRWRS